MPGESSQTLRIILIGVGAMNSPRYEPAGLLVKHGNDRVLIDAGPRIATKYEFVAWLVTDEYSELMREIRKVAAPMGLEPRVTTYSAKGLFIQPHSVIHTSHSTYGYTIDALGKKIVWAPEFLRFPSWAKEADLMFAEASSWNRPILFRGGVGGHASVEQVASDAQKYAVKKLVYAHIGRPTIRSLDAGEHVSFGEFGREGDLYLITRRGIAKGKARGSSRKDQ